MRAVVVEEFGTVDTPVVKNIDPPALQDNEVLLQVYAAPLNFVDLLVISGKYQFLPPRPFTPGKGPAGIVLKKGSAVTEFEVGDRVLAMAESGGYAEQAVAAEEQCYRLPDNMSFVDAASMSLAYDTAWFALHERGRMKAGETVLVLGATGAVGMAAMQLAKAAGARVLAGVSSLKKADELRELGADALIDLSADNLRDDLREQVYRVNDGVGADVVIDMVGGDVFDAAIRAVAWCGRLVVVGFASGRIPSIKANYLLVKNIEVSGLQISDYRVRDPQRVKRCFSEIFELYEKGAVVAAPATTLPLESFSEGLRMIEERKAKGRVILVPTE